MYLFIPFELLLFSSCFFIFMICPLPQRSAQTFLTFFKPLYDPQLCTTIAKQLQHCLNDTRKCIFKQYFFKNFPGRCAHASRPPGVIPLCSRVGALQPPFVIHLLVPIGNPQNPLPNTRLIFMLRWIIQPKTHFQQKLCTLHAYM